MPDVTGPTVPVASKPLWRTKSFWLGVAVAALPLFEYLKTSVEIEPEWLFHVLGGVIAAIRLVTVRPATMSASSEKVYVPQWDETLNYRK